MSRKIKVIAGDCDGFHDPLVASEHNLTHGMGIGFHTDEVYVFPVYQLGNLIPQTRLNRTAREFCKMANENDDKQFVITRSVLDNVPKYAFEGVRSNVEFEKSKEQLAEEKEIAAKKSAAK